MLFQSDTFRKEFVQLDFHIYYLFVGCNIGLVWRSGKCVRRAIAKVKVALRMDQMGD
jgi:hypothetical protein